MDQVTYAELNLHRNSGLRSSSPPSLPQNFCQRPCGHRFALKFGCVLIIIIIILSVIGFSASVMLRQKSLMEKHTGTHIPESWKNTTGTPLLLTCPETWKQQGKKCLAFSSLERTWNDSQVHCSKKGSTLLLIQDENELKEILLMNFKKDQKKFWIGLKFSTPEKKWKWVNDSFLTPNVLQIYGDDAENNCASISKKRNQAENCDAEIYYICQKDLQPVSNKVYSNS